MSVEPASPPAPLSPGPRPRHFRPGAPGGEQRTTWLELFFDLVFVFAVTQLSHTLLNHLTWSGAGQTAILLLVSWWAWNYTTWMTNWFDPDAIPVRILLLAAMLAALLMSIAIPEAFGGRAALFVGAYVGLQVMRNVFVTVWSVAAGVLWIAGAFPDGGGRVALWLAALAVELAGPATLYWIPGRPRGEELGWPIDAAHFAERFQLFVIIALGESIVVTGATAAELEMDPARVAAIGLAFVTSAALWWLYFNTVARRIVAGLGAADDSGRMARNAFTYVHIPIVAGIIVSAVGDELLIDHPGEELSTAGLLVLCGGPALYLVGHLLLRLIFTRRFSRTRTRALAGLAACGLLGTVLPALATAALVAATLVGVIAVEALQGPIPQQPGAGEVGPTAAGRASSG
jgi:low temperature requirement protein LtrA